MRHNTLPLLFPTVPGPVALPLSALLPCLLPEIHRSRMDGWCRSPPSPAQREGKIVSQVVLESKKKPKKKNRRGYRACPSSYICIPEKRITAKKGRTLSEIYLKRHFLPENFQSTGVFPCVAFPALSLCADLYAF